VLYVRIYMYVCICVCICIQSAMCVCVCVCVCVYVYVHIYVCTYIYVHIYVYTYMYVHIYVFIYICTYIAHRGTRITFVLLFLYHTYSLYHTDAIAGNGGGALRVFLTAACFLLFTTRAYRVYRRCFFHTHAHTHTHIHTHTYHMAARCGSSFLFLTAACF